jgi:hypothetical protein
MKIQITDIRKYSQSLRISRLCKNNKLLVCFITDHLHGVHLLTDHSVLFHLVLMETIVIVEQISTTQEKGHTEAFTKSSLVKSTLETHSLKKNF